MIRKACLAICFVLAGTLHAAPPFFIDATAGRYLVYEMNGAPVTVPVSELNVVVWDDGESDPDEPDIPVPPDDILTREVKQWAVDVGDPQGSLRYAVIMLMVREGLKGGQLGPLTADDVMSKSADAILSSSWDPFRLRLSSWMVRASQDGNLGTVDQWKASAKSIQDGLELSAAGADRISREEQMAIQIKVNEIIAEVTE